MDQFFAHLHHRLLSFKKQLAFAISKKSGYNSCQLCKKGTLLPVKHFCFMGQFAVYKLQKPTNNWTKAGTVSKVKYAVN